MTTYVLRTSRKQEKSVARDLGGRTQPGSGNQWFAKADVKTPDHLAECKFTDAKSYSLKAAELEKLLLEAMKMNREPVMQVSFTYAKSKRWAVLPWLDYLSLLDERAELNRRRKADRP